MGTQVPTILTNGIPIGSSTSPDRCLSLDTSSALPPRSLPFSFGVSPTSKLHFKKLPDCVVAVDATDPAEVKVYLDQENGIVIDIRPFNLYSALRLKSAYNVCVPTTLLKRQSYGLQQILNSTSLPQETKDKVIGHSTPMKVLVYDDSSSDDNVSFALYQMVHKFLKYECFTVAYLNGGLLSVDQLLMDKSAALPMRSPVSPTTPHSAKLSNAEFSAKSGQPTPEPRSDALPLLSGFTLPSATASNQKFLQSMKKTLPKIDTSVKYTYNLRLPEGFAAKKDKLPKWLSFFAENYGEQDYSKIIVDKLSEKFNKLEKTEQMRLNLAIAKVNEKEGRSPHYHACSPKGENVTPLAMCPCCDEIDYTIPKGIENGYKNRYKNIWPYEHSMVRLVSSPSCSAKKEIGDDYFNANYIDYPKLSDTKYIATQSPLEATYEDFWNTVWYNGVKAIVCLNNPLPLMPTSYYQGDQKYSKSDLTVKIGDTSKHEGFILREITITKHTRTHTVFHFAYSEWPDFGTPENLSTIFELMRLKNDKVALLSGQQPPISKIPKPWELLVHCSAGCGRTGCFITIDMVVSNFQNTEDSKYDAWGEDDLVYKSVQFQRQQRISMVQNLDQFVFCYESILNYVVDQLL